jgi:putative SOS response-associated peptidase YedK
MPVVIPTESRGHWLDPLADIEGLERLLVPAPESYFDAWPVSSVVNTPAFDDPSCILRLSSG